MSKQVFRSIGLMSGSSMDGIDGALCQTNGRSYCRQIVSASIRYEQEFRLKLRKAEQIVAQFYGNLEEARLVLADLDDIIAESTILHGQLCEILLNKAGLERHQVDLIGYHGQNLYHNPREKISLQVGDGRLLADILKIPVVNDFRSKDVASGGQGAPLAPLFHQMIAISNGQYPVAIVNCGGIANITIVTGSEEDGVIGFDTGPGNVLVDRYIRQKTNNTEFMDKDGKYGLQGRVNEKMLEVLYDRSINHRPDFFRTSPPKSLDSSMIHLPEELEQLSFYDACATLEAFTSYTIVDSLKLISKEVPKLWLLAGGGWYNTCITSTLMSLLKDIDSNIKVAPAKDFGFDGDYMEAEIFAYLGVRSFLGLPISLPSTTGVKAPLTGGVIYYP